MNTPNNYLRFPRTLNEAFGPYAGSHFQDAYNTFSTRSMGRSLNVALAVAQIAVLILLAAQ